MESKNGNFKSHLRVHQTLDCHLTSIRRNSRLWSPEVAWFFRRISSGGDIASPKFLSVLSAKLFVLLFAKMTTRAPYQIVKSPPGSLIFPFRRKNPFIAEVQSHAKKLNLKPVQRVTATFDPFHENVHSIRSVILAMVFVVIFVWPAQFNCDLQTIHLILVSKFEFDIVEQCMLGSKICWKLSTQDGSSLYFIGNKQWVGCI